MSIRRTSFVDPVEAKGRSVENSQPTEAEIEKALEYLAESRGGVVRAVEGVDGELWNFKPAADRWSIAEILEHMGVVEERLLENVFSRLSEAPEADAKRDVQAIDTRIVALGRDRSTGIKAPEATAPSGRWTPEESMQRILAGSEKIGAVLRAPGVPLRGRIVAHPVAGQLDGYQWVLLAAAHNERHTLQILEVKAMAGGAI